MRRHLDLLGAAALTLLGFTSVVVATGSIVRAVLGLPLALALPGFAVTAALFPRPTLAPAERTTLTLGASVALVALVGLILNWTPAGLRPVTWAVALSALTLVALALAFLRRGPHAGEVRRVFTARVAGRHWLLFGGAAAILAGAILVDRAGALQPPGPGFTELWMLPAGQAGEVRLGMTNMEHARVGYRLVLETGNRVLDVWSPIQLDPGASWEGIALLPSAPGARLDAVLFRADAPTVPYRHVVLEVPR